MAMPSESEESEMMKKQNARKELWSEFELNPSQDLTEFLLARESKEHTFSSSPGFIKKYIQFLNGEGSSGLCLEHFQNCMELFNEKLEKTKAKKKEKKKRAADNKKVNAEIAVREAEANAEEEKMKRELLLQRLHSKSTSRAPTPAERLEYREESTTIILENRFQGGRLDGEMISAHPDQRGRRRYAS